MRAVTAQRGTIRSVVSTNGKVEPLQNFEAHAPVGTTVKKILVREGDHVKKGQLLVQLNDAKARSQAAQARAQVLAAEADFSGIQSGGNREEILTLESQIVKARTDCDTAQRNVDALRRLQQQDAASPGEIKNAEDQLKRANADLDLLSQKQKNRYSQPEITRVEAQKSEAQAAYVAAEDVLSQLNIRAPFDGVVYSLPVVAGRLPQSRRPGSARGRSFQSSRASVRGRARRRAPRARRQNRCHLGCDARSGPGKAQSA